MIIMRFLADQNSSFMIGCWEVRTSAKTPVTDVIVSFVRTHEVLRSPSEHTTKNQDGGYEGVSVFHTDCFILILCKQVLLSSFMYAKYCSRP